MDHHLLTFDICSQYNIVQDDYTQSRRLIHIFPFIHTSGLFAYVCRHIHSGTVLPILPLRLFSSTVIDNAQYWWRHLQPSLYCPTQRPWGCSCFTHKTAKHHFIHSYEICMLMFYSHYRYIFIQLVLCIFEGHVTTEYSKRSQNITKKMFFKVE